MSKVNLSKGTFVYKIETTSQNQTVGFFSEVPQNSDYIDFTIDFGDGVVRSIVVQNQFKQIDHTYSSPGVYRVRIIAGDLGVLPGPPSLSDPLIKEVESWGAVKWESLDFVGQDNNDHIIDSYPDEIPVFGSFSKTVTSFFFGNNVVNGDPVNISIPDNIGQWDISNVTSLERTFSRNQEAANMPTIQNWDTSNVELMNGMLRNVDGFSDDLSTKEVTVDGSTYIAWDVSSVKNIERMFQGCSNLDVDIENWDTSSNTTLRKTFRNASFTKPNKNLNTRQVTVGDNTYTAWDISNTTSLFETFLRTNFDGNVKDWDTSSVTNMRGTFFNTPFNGDITGWDTSSVVNMRLMFNGANQFNQDLSPWNVSNVENFRGMFRQTNNFDQNLGLWDVSSATNMTLMFNESGISDENAAKTISGWINPAYNVAGNSVSDLPNDISIGFNSNDYTNFDQFGTGSASLGTFISGQEAIDRLRSENNWTIDIQNG